MTDIVDRLRSEYPDMKDAHDGANEIVSLRGEIKELEAENVSLREALKPFAEEEDAWIGFDDKERLVEPFPKLSDISRITVGDLRRARDVLKNN